MICLKCGGVMTDERVSDRFDPCRLWRCIQCGLMLDWLILKNREACKAAGVDMPKFMSEEHRQKWLESVRRTKMVKAHQGALLTMLKPSTPASVPIREGTEPLDANILAAIDQSLEQLARDRAALERAKEILSR
ncbi:MAG: hypothetical protein NTAFB01_13230 [Nitrospira sp.]